MAKLFVLILSLACASLYAEEIYKEVDSDGVPSFSDRAVLGTEPVKIQKTSTFTDDSLQRQKDMKAQKQKPKRSRSGTVQGLRTPRTVPQFAITLVR